MSRDWSIRSPDWLRVPGHYPCIICGCPFLGHRPTLENLAVALAETNKKKPYRLNRAVGLSPVLLFLCFRNTPKRVPSPTGQFRTFFENIYGPLSGQPPTNGPAQAGSSGTNCALSALGRSEVQVLLRSHGVLTMHSIHPSCLCARMTPDPLP
jgi:hypothetical protein